MRLTNVLFIESGEREASEPAIRQLYVNYSVQHLDVLTCFDTAPACFDDTRGRLLSVHAPEALENRMRYVDHLIAGHYDAVAILCSASGILAKWKYLIALRSRTKTFIVDEDAHLFPIDYAHRGQILDLISRRITSSLGIVGEAARLMGELIASPFVIGFLIVSTVNIHVRRWLRVHF